MTAADLGRRTAVALAGGALLSTAYQITQHFGASRAILRTACWTWVWLPFNAGWLWPYLSMMVLMALPWFLLPKWGQVRAFTFCLLGTAVVGWITFLAYPTSCARPAPGIQPWAYRLLVGVDGANNCLPCLHSAFAVFGAAVLWRSAPICRFRATRIALVLWTAAICVSIVALRQHTDADTLVGLILGGLAAWAYRRLERQGESAV